MTINEYEYKLQKYQGRRSRHTCPSCGSPFSFTRYVDAHGNCLSPEVGRCDHESACGYHKTPKQYFEEHPTIHDRLRSQRNSTPIPVIPKTTKTKTLCTIPKEILQRSVRTDIPSTFTTFLHSLFTSEAICKAIKKYRLGVTKARDIIYFQVDKEGRIRTGKIMKYNPQTGKRVKDPDTPFKINWVHSIMKRQGHLPKDWELTQCLFGEHLLSDLREKNKTIALVESEKTAIIASLIMPKYIWLATGGKSQLNPEKLQPLKNRKVIAFPDIDGYQVWKDKLSHLEGQSIAVSEILEKNATDRDREQHIDIADWLIRWRKETIQKYGSIDAIPIEKIRAEIREDISPETIDSQFFTNPAMRQTAQFFPASSWPLLNQFFEELELIPISIKCSDPI